MKKQSEKEGKKVNTVRRKGVTQNKLIYENILETIFTLGDMTEQVKEFLDKKKKEFELTEKEVNALELEVKKRFPEKYSIEEKSESLEIVPITPSEEYPEPAEIVPITPSEEYPEPVEVVPVVSSEEQTKPIAITEENKELPRRSPMISLPRKDGKLKKRDGEEEKKQQVVKFLPEKEPYLEEDVPVFEDAYKKAFEPLKINIEEEKQEKDDTPPWLKKMNEELARKEEELRKKIEEEKKQKEDNERKFQQEDTVICPVCKFKNEGEAKFCSDCGLNLLELVVYCYNCRAKNNGIAKFCTSCGVSLYEEEEEKPKTSSKGFSFEITYLKTRGSSVGFNSEFSSV